MTETEQMPPAIILAEPQLGENIGTAARAMANFGLTDLRLVNPRDGWPSEKARAAASRADHVIDAVRVYPDLPAAIADLSMVFATTARRRDMLKPVCGPVEAAGRIIAAPGRTGILFGRERWGLENDEVALCDAIVTYPVDSRFSSLNIAQAVLIAAYEWRKAAVDDGAQLPFQTDQSQKPATKGDMIGFFEHFETALDGAGYFQPSERRPIMVRNLRTILQKCQWSEDEVRTLRGVAAAFERVARGTDD
jgi:tRNA/rRNA methyltransferase